MLTYKNYRGHVTFDEEANIFHGEVINIRDVITFQSETAEEIKVAFQKSVNDYLALCITRKEAPEKPFSGKSRNPYRCKGGWKKFKPVVNRNR